MSPFFLFGSPFAAMNFQTLAGASVQAVFCCSCASHCTVERCYCDRSTNGAFSFVRQAVRRDAL